MYKNNKIDDVAFIGVGRICMFAIKQKILLRLPRRHIIPETKIKQNMST